MYNDDLVKGTLLLSEAFWFLKGYIRLLLQSTIRGLMFCCCNPLKCVTIGKQLSKDTADNRRTRFEYISYIKLFPPNHSVSLMISINHHYYPDFS